MKTFSEVMQFLEVRKVLRNRLQLASQSSNLRRGMINIFSHMPSFDTLLPFKLTFDFADSQIDHFDYWFNRFLERACADLFDARGNINPELLTLFNQNEYGAQLLDSMGMPTLARALLQCYCQHFMGNDIENSGHFHLCHWWQKKMDFLAEENFYVSACVNQVMEFEWRILCLLWRWVQYCAKHCVEDPVRFCTAIEYFYYSALHYLRVNNALPFDEEKMAVISEKLVAEIGLVVLQQEQANIIVGLYNTFYRCAKNRTNEIIQAIELGALLEKYPYLQEVATYQSCIIAQFFILGVMLNHSYNSSANVALLIQASHDQPEVAYYLEQQSLDYFYHRFDVNQGKNCIRQIKKVLQQFKPDVKKALAVRIQESIQTRQVLSHWLKYSEMGRLLHDFSFNGMVTLFEIDEAMNDYASILSQMRGLDVVFNIGSNNVAV